MIRPPEAWIREPLRTLVHEAGARLALVMTAYGQVVAQHGFTRSVDVMSAAALGAGIMASAEALGGMLGGEQIRLVTHAGPRQGMLLGTFDTPRGRWIALVVFGPQTSLGIVQFFFTRFAAEVATAMPVETAPRRVLAEGFERELRESLHMLFGR